jgi:PTH2 family peptidyl-tRNA hydrolase
MAKQVIVLRKFKNQRIGKYVSQGCHASMAAILNAGEMLELHGNQMYPYAKEFRLYMRDGSPMYKWLNGAFTKIVVYVETEKELLEIYAKSLSAGLPSSIITDNGKTEYNGVQTLTAVGIGPGTDEQIDPITGHLPLF